MIAWILWMVARGGRREEGGCLRDDQDVPGREVRRLLRGGGRRC